MRIAALLLAVAALGVSASLAVAAPPAGKGKPAKAAADETTEGTTTAKGKKPRTGEGCRPRVTVVLKGALVSVPGESGSVLTLAVASANAHGKAFLGTAALRVTLDEQTAVRRQGAKLRSALVAGDRALIQARVCKDDLGAETAPALVASRVIAHPATA